MCGMSMRQISTCEKGGWWMTWMLAAMSILVVFNNELNIYRIISNKMPGHEICETVHTCKINDLI